MKTDVANGRVCFYAGKLLDELFRLLGLVGEDYRFSGDDTLELEDLSNLLEHHYNTCVGPRIKKQRAIQRRSLAVGATATLKPLTIAGSGTREKPEQNAESQTDFEKMKTEFQEMKTKLSEFEKFKNKLVEFDKMKKDLEELGKKYNEAMAEIETLKKTSNKGPEEAQTVPAPVQKVSPKKRSTVAKKPAIANKLKPEIAASADNEVPEPKDGHGDAGPRRRTRAAAKEDANPGPSTRTRQIKPK